MVNETSQTKTEAEVVYKAEAYISEICIVGKNGCKVKLKPADGFGVKIPETSKALIAFVAVGGRGVLLGTDTYFEFPGKADLNSLLTLKQQHVRLSVEIGKNHEKIASVVIM